MCDPIRSPPQPGTRRLYETSPRHKTVSAIAALAVVGAGGFALVLGLAASLPIARTVQEVLVALTPMREAPPRPRPTPAPSAMARQQSRKAETARRREEASAVNLRNQATAVFAPVLPPIRQPPPVIAAPRPAVGAATNSGASNHVGPGQGAGGIGDGTGGGGNGDGDGDGDADTTTRPVQIKGKLYWSDLPKALRQSHRGGDLELTYLVEIDGHVSGCRVTRSSGMPDLDAQTCRLITQRFRFRPSRDASGRAVPAYIIERHGWDAAPADVEDIGDN
jgi:protein TonB